jgi:hypothetical protein
VSLTHPPSTPCRGKSDTDRRGDIVPLRKTCRKRPSKASAAAVANDFDDIFRRDFDDYFCYCYADSTTPGSVFPLVASASAIAMTLSLITTTTAFMALMTSFSLVASASALIPTVAAAAMALSVVAASASSSVAASATLLVALMLKMQFSSVPSPSLSSLSN